MAKNGKNRGSPRSPRRAKPRRGRSPIEVAPKPLDNVGFTFCIVIPGNAPFTSSLVTRQCPPETFVHTADDDFTAAVVQDLIYRIIVDSLRVNLELNDEREQETHEALRLLIEQHYAMIRLRYYREYSAQWKQRR